MPKALIIWTKDEIDKITGEENSKYSVFSFAILWYRNTINDPRSIRQKNVLFITNDVLKLQKNLKWLREIAEIRIKLGCFPARSCGSKPIDDKISSWNGLMISLTRVIDQVTIIKLTLKAMRKHAVSLLINCTLSKGHATWIEGQTMQVWRPLDDFAFLFFRINSCSQVVDVKYLEQALSWTNTISNSMTMIKADFWCYGSSKDIILKMTQILDGRTPQTIQFG